MDITQYRTSIIRPISKESPVGERLLEEPLFDFIEDQMMKVGSLSHAHVQWQEVEHSTITLLNDKSKDIKLLVYLLQCLHHQLTTKRFITSFGVMSDFISHYWQDSFPAPGKRGNLPRRKFFSQIARRFVIATEKFDFNALDSLEQNELQQAVQEWQSVIEQNKLASDVTESVAVTIINRLNSLQERQNITQSKPQEERGGPITRTSTPSSSLVTDNSSDKAAKQTLLKVAEYLSEQEFSGALAIRLRRHALWGGITTLPDHDHQGQTLLRGMQPERVKEYQEQSSHQPNLTLWRRLEQSLTIAPYWFEGQLMSYGIAKTLGLEDWCKAIVEETQSFIERFPTVVTLKFKGGAPFISDAVRDWLTAEQGSAAGAASGSVHWQEKRTEAFSLAKEGGLAVAMSMLNEGLVAAIEPRDRFYWRLLSADLLKHYHLEAMAKEQYQTLKKEITQTSVTDWEPSLIEQLEQNTTSD
ncbi:type VI secretion system ImpA domain-containing protein [Vibrio kanaloae]|uniref:type VI secretion system protein TssA n=1 Tax=Vibrio kanaloae TaxID=170673 RepID=UPI000C8478B4|nr:type VI secretion system protein TssA [Vibrio kanaloae]PMM00854.1 type VI secretion system ImpA domain-containing protein [Vibrio kanaloae]TKF75072.1 type VI secretion system protein TssA [Vibrio kanaloae]